MLKSPDHCRSVTTSVPSVQLIHQESRHHWIGSAILDGELYVFDSLQSKKTGLADETVSVLRNIYGELNEYITTDVTQQTGVTDCGLITAVCHGQRPEDYRLCQKVMRPHLIQCLESGEMLPFPVTKKRQRKPLVRWTF